MWATAPDPGRLAPVTAASARPSLAPFPLLPQTDTSVSLFTRTFAVRFAGTIRRAHPYKQYSRGVLASISRTVAEHVGEKLVRRQSIPKRAGSGLSLPQRAHQIPAAPRPTTGHPNNSSCDRCSQTDLQAPSATSFLATRCPIGVSLNVSPCRSVSPCLQSKSHATSWLSGLAALVFVPCSTARVRNKTSSDNNTRSCMIPLQTRQSVDGDTPAGHSSKRNCDSSTLDRNVFPLRRRYEFNRTRVFLRPLPGSSMALYEAQ
ncbi:hypothetical protein VT03_01055 [Planctomyces sp. SH-PL14]|nr:hypothetical protein VT03_01055 [Planctomyces sp. SH-PL14]